MIAIAMLIGLATVRPADADRVYLGEATAPQAMFAPTATAVRKMLELSDSEVETLGKALGRRIAGRSYPYLEVSVEGRVVGTVFLLDVIGQAQPITFAVAVNNEGVVRDVRVMVYRESHGDEIENHRFHQQFVGKSSHDPITLGKDVDAISGATISSRAEAFAVRKSLALSEILRHGSSQAGRSH